MSTQVLSRYSIVPRRFFLCDALPPEAEVDFHIKSGDYLATLSTIMGLLASLLEDCVSKGEPPHSYQIASLNRLREDLKYADTKYRIVPKSNSSI